MGHISCKLMCMLHKLTKNVGEKNLTQAQKVWPVHKAFTNIVNSLKIYVHAYACKQSWNPSLKEIIKIKMTGILPCAYSFFKS
jgi:hypothetical protein